MRAGWAQLTQENVMGEYDTVITRRSNGVERQLIMRRDASERCQFVDGKYRNFRDTRFTESGTGYRIFAEVVDAQDLSPGSVPNIDMTDAGKTSDLTARLNYERERNHRAELRLSDELAAVRKQLADEKESNDADRFAFSVDASVKREREFLGGVGLDLDLCQMNIETNDEFRVRIADRMRSAPCRTQDSFDRIRTCSPSSREMFGNVDDLTVNPSCGSLERYLPDVTERLTALGDYMICHRQPGESNGVLVDRMIAVYEKGEADRKLMEAESAGGDKYQGHNLLDENYKPISGVAKLPGYKPKSKLTILCLPDDY